MHHISYLREAYTNAYTQQFLVFYKLTTLIRELQFLNKFREATWKVSYTVNIYIYYLPYK